MAKLLTQDKEEEVIPRTASGLREQIRLHDVSFPAPPETPQGQMQASKLAGGTKFGHT